jgi:arsenite-transporting ATPase
VHLSFFIGKGGVGKTTVSSAFAVHSALTRPRESVLLISTDPAHSLADLFELRFADSPRRIPTPKGKLFGWQINAEKLFHKFLGRRREEIFELLESGSFFTREEIEPLLSTNLPGMAEMAALIAIHDLLQSKQYDRLVIDTAPLGHTLRALEMPGHFVRFLDFLDVASSRDAVLAATFGGKSRISHTFVHEWRTMAGEIEDALRPALGQPRRSELVLVTTAENFALQESLRARDALERDRLQISRIVLNRIAPKNNVRTSQKCRRCMRDRESGRRAESFLKKHFPETEILRGEDAGSPILGTKELAAYGAHVFAEKKFTTERRPPAADQNLEQRFERSRWPRLNVPLALTLGKGGVGKTTISAALAFAELHGSPRKQVTICSTDPAPSLDDVFRQQIGDELTPVYGNAGLRAAEFDSVAEFERWSKRMKGLVEEAFSAERGGLHVDLSFERRLFSALLDIVPPGVDEILAIFRILDLVPALAGKAVGREKHRSVVIVDMAPTGHALELLRMPGRMLDWSRLVLKALARHRQLPMAQDAAVEIAGMSQRVRELAGMLHDGRQSLVIPVMLAEPLPDRETGRLLRALNELGASTSPVFVNRVLFERDVKNCARCRRARAWQLATLRKLEQGLKPGQSLWIVRNFPEEVAGPGRLQSFVRELWQLQRATNGKERRRQGRAAEES